MGQIYAQAAVATRSAQMFWKTYFGDAMFTQLYWFSDASYCGYDVLAYVRFTNQDGVIHCSLLYSCYSSCKTYTQLQQELDMDIDSTYFWTDGMAVIRYIANKKTRFHKFVVNRLAVILECSNLKRWKYTESTPANVL